MSLVVTLSTGEMIEAAMVGRDGVVGASAALDGKISLSRGIIQLSGEIVVRNRAAEISRAAKPKTAVVAHPA